jgi:CheY-like chemotaxis protein
MRVLIVDDEESSRELIRLHLKSLGVTDVHVAEDGRQALRLLDSLQPPPDLIFSDVFMPDTDGFETLAGLRKRAYSGGVVLISGRDLDMLSFAQTVANDNYLNLWGTLVKPVGVDTVARVLGPHLKKT